MNINFSENKFSKYCLYQDIPITFALRHLKLALFGGKIGLPLIERCRHVMMGALEFIPLIGIGLSLAEKKLHLRKIRFLDLKETDPYKRGLEHGKALKKQIAEIYTPVLNMLKNDAGYQLKSKFSDKNFPEDIRQELLGLAKGSGFSYDDVLQIHTFLDVKAGSFGCSTMAYKTGEIAEKRIAAANHSLKVKDNPIVRESEERRQGLLKANIKLGSETKALQASDVEETIQSIVFDTKNGNIQVSASGSHAALKKFKTFSSKNLFGKEGFKSHDKPHQVHLMRNLDWPWYFLGQNTLVLSRKISDQKRVATVTFPGYIGSLSGMNSEGFALSLNQSGYAYNENKIPCPLLFTHLLDTCSDVQSAMGVLNRKLHGSDMNLVIADQNSSKSLELYWNFFGGIDEVGSID